MDGTLDAGEYKATRTNPELLIRDMEEKLGNLSQKDTNLDAMLKYGTYFFENLDQLYFTGDLVIKQQIVGSMFPEKSGFVLFGSPLPGTPASGIRKFAKNLPFKGRN